MSQQVHGNIFATAGVVAKTMVLADRLVARMKVCNLSQAALAREVGVSQQSIGRLVSGEAVGSRYLHKIAAALKTTPAYLSGETDDPTSDVPDDTLTIDERELVDSFRRLTPKDQAAMRQLIGSLAGEGPAPSDQTPTASATVHSTSRSFAGKDIIKGEAA